MQKHTGNAFAVQHKKAVDVITVLPPRQTEEAYVFRGALCTTSGVSAEGAAAI